MIAGSDASSVGNVARGPRKLAACLCGVALAACGGETPAPAPAPAHLYAADAPAGELPGAIAVGEGATWALDFADGSVRRVGDRPATIPASRRTRTPGLPRLVTGGGIAAGEGGVWVVDWTDELIRIDSRRGRVEARIALPGTNLNHVAVGEGSVWVLDTSGPGYLRRVDPASNRPIGRPAVVGGSPEHLVVGEGAAWVGTTLVGRRSGENRGVVTRFTVGSGALVRRDYAVRPGLVEGLAVGGGRFWLTAVLDRRGAVMLGYSTRTGRLDHTTELFGVPRGLAADARNVWVTQWAESLRPTLSAREVVTTRNGQGLVTRYATGDGRLTGGPLAVGEVEGPLDPKGAVARLPIAVGGARPAVASTYDGSVTTVSNPAERPR